MENIYLLDIIFGILTLFLVIKSTFNGFVSEFMATLALIGAFLCSMFFSPWVAEHLNGFTHNSKLTPLFAFLLTFIVVFVVAKILETCFHRGVDKISLNKLDKALGLFYGLFESSVIILILLLVINNQTFVDCRKLIGESYIAQIGMNMLDYIGWNNINDIPFIRNL